MSNIINIIMFIKCIFLNENVWILLNISVKFVPKVQVNNIPALVQIMPWHRSSDKPLSEPMMASFLTHTCITRPQWVNPSQLTEACIQCWKMEIPTGPPVRGQQLWRRTRNFFSFFFNFMSMIWDSRHEDLQLFWLSFKHCIHTFNKLYHHWCRKWLIARSAPSRCLNQCWPFVD